MQNIITLSHYEDAAISSTNVAGAPFQSANEEQLYNDMVEHAL